MEGSIEQSLFHAFMHPLVHQSHCQISDGYGTFMKPSHQPDTTISVRWPRISESKYFKEGEGEGGQPFRRR